LVYRKYMRHTPTTDFPGLLLPVNIPCVDTAIKTWCYQQSISWRKFYVLYPVWMTMKSAYLRLQIPSIPQCYSTVITACRKNTRIQKSKTYNAFQCFNTCFSLTFLLLIKKFLVRTELEGTSSGPPKPTIVHSAVTCLWILYLHNLLLKSHCYN